MGSDYGKSNLRGQRRHSALLLVSKTANWRRPKVKRCLQSHANSLRFQVPSLLTTLTHHHSAIDVKYRSTDPEMNGPFVYK